MVSKNEYFTIIISMYICIHFMPINNPNKLLFVCQQEDDNSKDNEEKGIESDEYEGEIIKEK